MTIKALAAAVSMALALPLLADGGEKTGLEAGDQAPRFSMAGSDGRTHTLEEHLGKRAVVIAWFPKAFTGG